MATTDDERSWVVRAQWGDRDAVESLLRSVQRPLHRYVARLVGETAADDVVQDTLISIARKLTWLSDPRLFRSWAFRIASRASLHHLRKQRRQGHLETDEETLESLAAPAGPIATDVLRELLDSSVLSPASRAVLLLHFEEEMPLAEVAAVLEIPLGTAKSRLAYGLTALRRYLDKKKEPTDV